MHASLLRVFNGFRIVDANSFILFLFYFAQFIVFDDVRDEKVN